MFDPNAAESAYQSTLLESVARYDVEVDYDLSSEETIRAGKYDNVCEGATVENYPPAIERTGKARIVVELLRFANPNLDSRSYKTVLAEYEKMGLRKIELRELLAFGATYPQVQRYYSVVAVGLLRENGGWSHGLTNVLLSGDSGKINYLYRSLTEGWTEGRLYNDIFVGKQYFAAVRKQ